MALHATPAWAVIYYVDAIYGTDATGAPDNINLPYQTINKINELFQAGTIVHGDYVKFRRGTFDGQQMFRGWIYLGNCSGTLGAPITITSYAVNSATETYKPVINTSMLVAATNGPCQLGITWTGPTNGVYSATLAYSGLWEDGHPITIATTSACSDGNAYYDSSAGVLYYRPTSGTPANHTLEISGYAGRAIYMQGANNYFTIDGLKFTREGIYANTYNSGSNLAGWTVQNCDFIYATCHFNNDYPGDGSIRYYWSDVTVQNCRLDYSSGAALSFESDNGPGTFLRLNVLNNVVTHNNTFPAYGACAVDTVWQTRGDNDCIAIQNMKDSNIICNDVSGHAYDPGNCAGIHYWEGGAEDAVNITGAVNNGSGLIRLTGGLAHSWAAGYPGHNYRTGDHVNITAVGGVPSATGVWTVTVIDANQFDLQGSIWAGSYTTGGLAVQEADLPQTGNVCAKNYIHDIPEGVGGIWWDSGTLPSKNTVQIYGNIVANCAGNGLNLVRPQVGSTCYNNTIYNCAKGIALHTTNNWTVKNNIVVNVSGAYIEYNQCESTDTITCDYNVFYPGDNFSFLGHLTNGTFTQWKALNTAGAPWDAHSIQANPMLTNQSGILCLPLDFQLQFSSPCIKSGINVRLTKDFWNNPIPPPPSPVDIGVHQLSQSTPMRCLPFIPLLLLDD